MKFQKMSGHPAKRTFQAIRIELNQELTVLRESLDEMIDLLNKGGRICIITFHSLEDRIVKEAFRRNENPCTCPSHFPVCVCGKKSKGKVITRKPILPGETETVENSRSKSAKLRIFEHIWYETSCEVPDTEKRERVWHQERNEEHITKHICTIILSGSDDRRYIRRQDTTKRRPGLWVRRRKRTSAGQWSSALVMWHFLPGRTICLLSLSWSPGGFGTEDKKNWKSADRDHQPEREKYIRIQSYRKFRQSGRGSAKGSGAWYGICGGFPDCEIPKRRRS